MRVDASIASVLFIQSKVGLSLLQIEQHICIGSAHMLLRNKSHSCIVKLIPKHPRPAEHGVVETEVSKPSP